MAGKLATVKWKQYQTRLPTLDELHGWQWDGLGIITGAVSNLVAVDCDSMDEAKRFWTMGGKSLTMVRTRRGVHFFFSHPGHRVKNRTKVKTQFGTYDIRGDGGLVVAPPSPNRAWVDKYQLRHTADLPVFRDEWLPAGEGAAQRRQFEQKDIRSPEAYISKIVATSGQGGHDATFKACSYLREAGLSKMEATIIMARWNLTNADPPWSDSELAHKLGDVFGV